VGGGEGVVVAATKGGLVGWVRCGGVWFS
jgi:hypothetical protein